MYTPTQLEVIRVFGRKELTEGCLINISYTGLEHREMGGDDYELNIKKEIVGKYICESNGDDFDFYYDFGIYNFRSFGEDAYANDFEILGHIPHLEDVFRVAKEKGIILRVSSQYNALTTIPNDGNEESKRIDFIPSISLLEQQESTLLELLKLFK